MDFLSFWHLKERPFDGVRNPRFFFESEDHLEALERLFFLCRDKTMNIGLLTGEVGCGKTLTWTVLENRLDPKEFSVACFPNSHFDFNDLLFNLLGQIKFQRPDLSAWPPPDPGLRADKFGLMASFTNSPLLCPVYPPWMPFP